MSESTPSAYILTPIPTPILIPRPRPRPKPAVKIPPTPRPRPKWIPELIPVDMDEFDKMEMAKKTDQYQN